MCEMSSFSHQGLRPETTSEDIFSACRDGDEFYCKEWTLNPENDINITYVYNPEPFLHSLHLSVTNKPKLHWLSVIILFNSSPVISMVSALSTMHVYMVTAVLLIYF